jgi:hypothetical protein
MRARSAEVCCAGSVATAATFPGGEPAIRIASWCRSSCCSRPRSRGSRDLPPVSGALPHPGGPRVSPSGYRARELGGPGLLSKGGQPAPAGPGSGPTQRRRHSLGHRRAAPSAGSRAVHLRGGRELCFRARGHADRYQRGPGASPGIPFPSQIEGVGSTARAIRRDAPAEGWQESLDLQSGNYGAGSADLYRAGAPLRDVSGAGGLSDGCSGSRKD